MSRLPLKKQVALPLLFAAVFGLTYYILLQISPTLPPNANDQQRMAHVASVWTLDISRAVVSIILWMCISLAVVRALNELVFYIFRRRKGYDPPSLMRDLFSLVLFITALTLIIKYNIEGVSFAALLPGSALLGVILGLALQDTLGNLFSGISLHADKPFQVGDVISSFWRATAASLKPQSRAAPATARTRASYSSPPPTTTRPSRSSTPCARRYASARTSFAT